MTTADKPRYIVRPASDRPGFIVWDTKLSCSQAARSTMDAAQAYADDKNERAS